MSEALTLPASIARHGIVTRGELLDGGIGGSEIDDAVRRGSMVSVARGSYVSSQIWEAADSHDRLVLRCLARGGDDADLVASHCTAAGLWRLPRLLAEPDHRRLWFIAGTGHSATRSRELVVVGSALPPSDRAHVEDVPVTSLGRTALDLARRRGADFRDSVIVMDGALRAGASRDGMLAWVESARCWPGVRQARRVLAFADDRAESPGESLSRVVMARLGWPAAQLQWEVQLDGAGRWIVRTDFGWPDLGVLGEFDGRLKYASGDARVLLAEKHREDALRDAGWELFRWGWSDLWPPYTNLQQRWTAACRRAVGRRLAS